MVITQEKSRRKPSGKRYKKSYRKKKRKYEIGRAPTLTKLGPRKVDVVRTKGGGEKHKLVSAEEANIYDPKAKKHFKVKIKTILENPANRHFVRRNIMTKGCIIETEKGKARITSRPGQEGTINAVLI
jgi:small subunit ribosomal protein S8e